MFLESRRERSAGGFSLDDAAITRELMSMSNDLNSPFYPATTYSFARPVSASNPDFSAWNTTGRGTSVFGGDMSLLRHNRGSRCADRGLPHDSRADGAKPFAGWRGLQHLAKHHEVDMDIAKHLQSSQSLCRPNPILYPDCPSPTFDLHCTSNYRRTYRARNNASCSESGHPTSLSPPLSTGPSLSHGILGIDTHAMPIPRLYIRSSQIISPS